jgi:hypothetical protein
MTDLETEWHAFSVVYDLVLFQKFVFCSFFLYLFIEHSVDLEEGVQSTGAGKPLH